MERFVVLTGGPGSGKSTVVSALAALGYAVTTEAGRALVRSRVGAGDPVAFAEALLDWERRSYAWALKQDGTVYFDRGMPDVAGAWLQMGRPVPPHVESAIAEAPYGTVLIAPPWREIYVHDEERKHSWETAVATYEVMVEAYGRYGYDLVELPRGTVEERVAFVLGLG